ncbi:Rieske (2Fe-2S) protein [Sphingomonas hengshuiensis]|uniref:2Fe-2S ferredoxin n=1 Tax=Sphingomonas hengshuiensis TaxID=1609977 RepID=A0A7U4J7E3_9SPHN|nr:Rieske (2Fe-2S) protein [Sphingomonas hengshuiensis]AJP71626.1 2Fe-2S ferredoxin [Sphingomonas hengshuiensis]
MTARLTETPPGITLGALELVTDGSARNFVIEMRAGRFHGFVVRRGDTLTGYVDRCPHMGVPMAQTLDEYLTGDGTLIQCSWHGALFRIDDGACVGGPCAGARLNPWPVQVRDGMIVTA